MIDWGLIIAVACGCMAYKLLLTLARWVKDFADSKCDLPNGFDYYYEGVINVHVDNWDVAEKIEEEFNKANEGKLIASLNSYENNILRYGLISTEKILPSKVIEFEKLFTDGKIKINLAALKNQ